MYIIFRSFFLFILANYILMNQVVVAHDGHDHAPTTGTDTTALGPVKVSAIAQQNLGLKTKAAEIGLIEKVVAVPGKIEAIPEQTEIIASRIAGQVKNIFVQNGKLINKGQELVEIESLQVGDPPPRTILRAQLSGTVLDLSLVPGEPLISGRELMRVANLNQVYVRIQLFETQLANLQIGSLARLTTPAVPNQVFTAEMKILSAELDVESKTLSAWLIVNNTEQQLKPNMSATVNLILDQTANAIIVPRSAILGESGTYFVFVQSDSDSEMFERRYISIGLSNDLFVEVIEGVLPAEQVVTIGNYQLQYLAAQPISDNSIIDQHSHSFYHIVIWLLGSLFLIALVTLGYFKLYRHRYISNV